MRKLLAVGVVVVGFLLVQVAPASAAVTITAKAVGKPTCYNSARIEGYLTPATATPRVVLQRTVGGKWQDWKWYTILEEGQWRKPHILTSGIGDGGIPAHYSVQYLGTARASIIHLRVRSNGGSVVSPGVYVKSTC
mgnify:CR=1 FL=1